MQWGPVPDPASLNEVLVFFESAKQVTHPADLPEGYMYSAGLKYEQPRWTDHPTSTGMVWVDDDNEPLRQDEPWDAVGYWQVIRLNSTACGAGELKPTPCAICGEPMALAMTAAPGATHPSCRALRMMARSVTTTVTTRDAYPPCACAPEQREEGCEACNFTGLACGAGEE